MISLVRPIFILPGTYMSVWSVRVVEYLKDHYDGTH